MSLWTRNETFLLSSADKKAYRRCCSGCPVGDDESFWWHSLNPLPFRAAKCLESHFRFARTCSDPIETKATKHCRTTSSGHRRNDMDMVGWYVRKMSGRYAKAMTCVWIQRRWTQNLHTGVGANGQVEYLRTCIRVLDISTARVICNGTCRRWVMIVDCGRLSLDWRLYIINIISVVLPCRRE